MPLLTLHHFVHPGWFDDAGGWGSQAGTRHFVAWAAWAVREFGARVRHWATFNEPGVLVSSGWCTGFFPPGKASNDGVGWMEGVGGEPRPAPPHPRPRSWPTHPPPSRSWP